MYIILKCTHITKFHPPTAFNNHMRASTIYSYILHYYNDCMFD